ncbi:MAG TPA: hypothetical protein VFQ85_18050 [Mycobacteriales bacterium]|jgi:hypothetical protein|nr:hypothetical protein [Mycobacteriales bacterium]
MTRALLLLSVAAAAAFAAPAAHADTTCQDVAGVTTACVTVDTATPGVGVQAGPLCVVVLASCS